VTPDALASAISGVAPPIPLPEPAPLATRGFDSYDGGQRGGYGNQRGGYGDQRGGYGDQRGGYGDQRGYGDQGGYRDQGGPGNPNDPGTWNPRSGGGGAGYQRGYQPAGRGGASRAVVTVVVVLVLVAVAAGAWAIVNSLGKSGSSGNDEASGIGSSSSPKSGSSTAPAATVLSPQSAMSFDILGSSPSPESQNILDPIKGSGPPWQTQNYASPDFGKLKNGDGYLIEMGSTVRVTLLQVDFAASPATAGICIGNQTTTTTSGMDMSTACPEGFTSVAPQQTINGETTFNITGGSAIGQDVLIWFTKMTSSGNESISKISVYGSAASSAG
jgi:hypothetical protein